MEIRIKHICALVCNVIYVEWKAVIRGYTEFGELFKHCQQLVLCFFFTCELYSGENIWLIRVFRTRTRVLGKYTINSNCIADALL